MEVPQDILNDIADNMEAGFKCFLHRKTLEVVTYLDQDQYPDMDSEVWQEEIDKIFNDRENYIEIENMNSSESFKAMEDFVETVDDNILKIQLIQALENKKPFKNFKYQIDNSGGYREQWFAFRTNKNIDWIKRQLNIDPL